MSSPSSRETPQPNFSDIHFQAPPRLIESPSLHAGSLLESVVPLVHDIQNGAILSKHEAILTIAFLIVHPELASFFLKAMHFQFPDYEDRRQKPASIEPVQMFHVLDRALTHASHLPVQREIHIDHFLKQFDHNKLSWRLNNPATADKKTFTTAITMLNDFGRRKRSKFEQMNHRPDKLNWREIFKGLRHRNIHSIADGIPSLPLNVYRYHDHRKVWIFTFQDSRKLLFLPTCNFDSPTDLDCALTVTDPEIIKCFEELVRQPLPQNAVIHGDGWSIYQDGCQDLDPTRTIESSPILSRLYELTASPDTHSIIQTSQFLPDMEQLEQMEIGLKTGRLKSVQIFAPDAKMWSLEYKLTGGLASRNKVEKLQKKYPGQFQVQYTQDRFLHAKIVIINGRKLLLGSHNWNQTLTKARTTEFVLEQDQMEPVTLESLASFFQEISAAS